MNAFSTWIFPSLTQGKRKRKGKMNREGVGGTGRPNTLSLFYTVDGKSLFYTADGKSHGRQLSMSKKNL